MGERSWSPASPTARPWQRKCGPLFAPTAATGCSRQSNRSSHVKEISLRSEATMQPPPPPHQNTQLLGHEDAESLVLDAVGRGRLHHAWLISGMAGIGKATLAWRMARYLLAQSQPPAEAGLGLLAEEPPPLAKPASLFVAAEHPDARMIAARSHPNLRFIERHDDQKTGKVKASIGVEQIRDLQGFFQTKAGESAHRIVIIDAVDDLTAQAQNSLLKMLEEPPSGAFLILVSHIPGRLLPTIRSRCRHLPMHPLPEAVMQRLLLQAEVPEETIKTALILGEGSFGRALEMISGGAEVYYTQILEQLTAPTSTGRRAIADQLAAAGGATELPLWGEVLDWLLTRLARQMVRPNRLDAPEFAAAQSLSRRLGLESVLEAAEECRKLLAEALELNLDRRQIVLEVFAKL
ncbi:MAG: DNA polymerase III subunit delta' [Alphaproteobacteria bacterium]|nr:DNA polymerase III subunit delta' [Alphaproteobacteria bacterium]